MPRVDGDEMRTYVPGDRIVMHPEPAWRAKANFIRNIFLGTSNGKNEWEQLWLRKIQPAGFEVCCIPILAYGVSLGDVINVNPDGDISLIHRSEYRTFRVWFDVTPNPAACEDIRHHFQNLDVLFEWSHNRGILAVCPFGVESARATDEYLLQLERNGLLSYEINSLEF